MATEQDLLDKLTYGDLKPNRWCRFGVHKWGRWAEVRRGFLRGEGEKVERRFMEMSRYCDQCGRVDMETIKEWV